MQLRKLKIWKIATLVQKLNVTSYVPNPADEDDDDSLDVFDVTARATTPGPHTDSRKVKSFCSNFIKLVSSNFSKKEQM